MRSCMIRNNMPNKTHSIPKLNGKLEANVSLAPWTTLRMGGPADFFWEPEDIKTLSEGIRKLHAENIPWMILGGGSNLLISSRGYHGVVIHLVKEFGKVSATGISLSAGAGATFAKILQGCVEKSLSGIEFLVGVPATLGGAIAMNFGAHGKAIGDFIQSVRVVKGNGDIATLYASDLQLGYRHSIFLEEKWIVCEAELSLIPSTRTQVKESIQKLQEERRLKQPLASLSCGCLFKNPPQQSAGFLIEKAGCKGLRRGGAVVSTHHANFLLNEGEATPEDAYALLLEVQKRVFEHSGVRLEPEARLIGFGDD